ncbi:hypothetical protein J7E98_05960, partial [Streptomyces sp. ISL-86]|nr:hypothetical protein [Streptomyces sp. ISL-86]
VSGSAVAAAAAGPAATASASAGIVGDVPEEAYEELAGSVAGVGRDRPGRPAAEPANPETMLASRPLRLRPRPEPPEPPEPVAPPPPVAPQPSGTPRVTTALGTGPNDRAADLAAHILPLGTGFALMGIGFGCIGMRLRKGL